MEFANILMCVNIPKGITEDLLCELFCAAGPIEDISISRSGRSCFIIYEFEEAVKTAKEIFQDVKLYGRPLEMFDHTDIVSIHEKQQEESKHRRENEHPEKPDHRFPNRYLQSNPFCSNESMTPKHESNYRGHKYFSHQHQAYGVATPFSHNGISPDNQPQRPEFDLFQNPYHRQPAHFRNYYADGDASNQTNFNNHTESHSYPGTSSTSYNAHFNRKRHSDNSHPNFSHQSYKQQKHNHDQISDDSCVDLEKAYEDKVRRSFHDNRKPPYYRNKYNNAPSTSSDYVIRNKYKPNSSPYQKPERVQTVYDRRQSEKHRQKHEDRFKKSQ